MVEEELAASGISGSTTGDGRWESTPLLPTRPGSFNGLVSRV